MVDFDIAVSADFRSDSGGKLALKVAGIGGIEGEGGAALIVVPYSVKSKLQIPIT